MLSFSRKIMQSSAKSSFCVTTRLKYGAKYAYSEFKDISTIKLNIRYQYLIGLYNHELKLAYVKISGQRIA